MTKPYMETSRYYTLLPTILWPRDDFSALLVPAEIDYCCLFGWHPVRLLVAANCATLRCFTFMFDLIEIFL